MLQRINIFLSNEQISFLKSLAGTISEHIRRALDEYIEKIKPLASRASASKKRGE